MRYSTAVTIERTKLLRRLHAIAKQLSMDHEQLREACGVESLATARIAVLRDAVARLSRNVPAPKDKRPRRGRPAAPGTIRLVTPKQRWKIQDLIKRLGWESGTVLQKLGGSWEREPETGAFSGRFWSPEIQTTTDASNIINLLIGECRRLGIKDRR